MRREHAERDDEHVPERLEIVRVEAGVHDEEEDGRDLCRTREGVLDGRVLGEELGREVVGRQVLVVRREGVALEAEGADPELGADVELTVGDGQVRGREEGGREGKGRRTGPDQLDSRGDRRLRV